MRRRWVRERAALFTAAAPARRAGAAAPRGAGVLVGRDLSKAARRAGASRTTWIAAVLTCVVAALLLTSLRLAILRARYQLGEATRQEEALLQRDRSATVELQRLRDPSRLRRLAEERGFVPAQHIIVLPVPGDRP